MPTENQKITLDISTNKNTVPLDNPSVGALKASLLMKQRQRSQTNVVKGSDVLDNNNYLTIRRNYESPKVSSMVWLLPMGCIFKALN